MNIVHLSYVRMKSVRQKHFNLMTSFSHFSAECMPKVFVVSNSHIHIYAITKINLVVYACRKNILSFS